MIIKPSVESRIMVVITAIGLIAILGSNVFMYTIGFYEMILFMLPFEVFLIFVLMGSYCLLCKTVELCPEGYWVTLGSKRVLYRWEDVKTKRLEDYSKVWDRAFNNNRFPEGIIFSVDTKKRPKWMHPAMFCSLTHPFSSFYVSFEIQEKKKFYEYYYMDEYMIVDKQKLLKLLESYGVQLEPKK